ncbi:MAG: UDP pyrophosphate phosphatase [Bacillaceae bacterium]|nr:UDP pyrophosphate phosphatase [Bacillaceae bacterium]
MDDLLIFFKYIFLGIVQGVTEPLPVSSSGHLRVVQYFFGVGVPNLHFEVFLNGASLLAVFVVYRHDLLELIKGTISYVSKREKQHKQSFRFSLLIVIGTIPAVLIGGFFSKFIGSELTNIYIVAFALTITGIALLLIRNLKGNKNENEITLIDTVIVGMAQALALIPGISRSGATVVAALGRNVEPKVALKFSFFLSIPVSVGSLVFKLGDIGAALIVPGLTVPYITAFLVSFLVSIMAIKLFINLVTNGKLLYFSIYCFSISLLIFIFA